MRYWFSCGLLIALGTVWGVAGAVSTLAAAELDALKAQNPHYVLNLNLNEFSILNVSEMDGLLKYGGSGDFQLRMAKEGNEVVWTVTISSSRLMELLAIFVGERTIKLVQAIDASSIDANQKLALQAIKSLTQKLESAQKNPVWDSVKLSGTVRQQGEDWVIQSKQASFKITGTKLEDLKRRLGKPVVADGSIKVPGQFEVTGFLDKRENTLELFVMSFCPYAQRAEMAIYNYLAQTNGNAKPALDLHFVIYKQKKEGREVFAALHGEEELTENLVQMIVRDLFPGALEPYLRLRAGSGKVPWQSLAEKAGLTQENVAQVQTAIVNQRDSLLRQEYDYAFGRYGISDGSPTFVWESERVPDLQKIDAFKGFDGTNHEACLQ